MNCTSRQQWSYSLLQQITCDQHAFVITFSIVLRIVCSLFSEMSLRFLVYERSVWVSFNRLSFVRVPVIYDNEYHYYHYIILEYNAQKPSIVNYFFRSTLKFYFQDSTNSLHFIKQFLEKGFLKNKIGNEAENMPFGVYLIETFSLFRSNETNSEVLKRSLGTTCILHFCT